MSSSFMSQAEIEKFMSTLGADTTPAEKKEAEPCPEHEVESVTFPELVPHINRVRQRDPAFFNAIPVKLSLVLGGTTLTVREILNLQKDAVIKLDSLAGENATLCVNGKPLAAGEVVVINDNFGCRVADIVPRDDSGTEKV